MEHVYAVDKRQLTLESHELLHLQGEQAGNVTDSMSERGSSCVAALVTAEYTRPA